MGKRILYVCGGRSFYIANLMRKIVGVAECFRELGHEVDHVCGGDVLKGSSIAGSCSATPADASPIEFSRMKMLEPLGRSVSEYRDIRHDSLLLRNLRRRSSASPVDLVWDRSVRLHSAALTHARSLRVPYVLEWKDHLIPYSSSLFRKRALMVERRKLAEADYIVVESGVLRERLSAKEGVNIEKILVAHNAVDCDEFRRQESLRCATRKSLGVQTDEVLVGYIGSYSFYHDAERLVRAARELKRKGLERVRFLMVGAGLEYRKCSELASEFSLLDGTLQLMDTVPKAEVPAILSALDIAVLPGSTDIICPIKVQEFMAMELPALVPDYACNREVIVDGETGSLFEPRNELDLASKIAALASDPELRRRLGSQGRQVMVERFSWRNTWGKALETIIDGVR